jgi:hypothetical protein
MQLITTKQQRPKMMLDRKGLSDKHGLRSMPIKLTIPEHHKIVKNPSLRILVVNSKALVIRNKVIWNKTHNVIRPRRIEVLSVLLHLRLVLLRDAPLAKAAHFTRMTVDKVRLEWITMVPHLPCKYHRGEATPVAITDIMIILHETTFILDILRSLCPDFQIILGVDMRMKAIMDRNHRHVMMLPFILEDRRQRINTVPTCHHLLRLVPTAVHPVDHHHRFTSDMLHHRRRTVTMDAHLPIRITQENGRQMRWT